MFSQDQPINPHNPEVRAYLAARGIATLRDLFRANWIDLVNNAPGMLAPWVLCYLEAQRRSRARQCARGSEFFVRGVKVVCVLPQCYAL